MAKSEKVRSDENSEKRKLYPNVLIRYLAGKGEKEFDIYKNPAMYDSGAQGRVYKRDNLARGVADVVEMVSNNPGSTSVLEIGAGTGFLSLELMRRGFDVTALDLFHEPLRWMKKKEQMESQKVPIVAVQADMNESLPFADGSFNTVTSLRATRFIKDFDAWLSEAHRVLKPGGVFVLPVFLIDFIPWKRHSDMGLSQETSFNGVVSHFKRAGFSIDRELSSKYSSLVDTKTSERKVPWYYKPKFVVGRK
ncbi:MAG: class I SAM-dependent methyltransferase [Candidatus Levybacteria bacterium]|nr:class I SAM-dependent methyltransferase [Candidatus Levybacteria bacterium]MBP9815406.1 class I SAM-dependent methyltransferase [Candidatus Levybacteria bacterium]